MPVRKVVTRSGKHFRGRFPSRKNRIMVCWESLHERDAILLLEYSPIVASYEAQPSEETYYVRGVPHKYYPDLRAKLISEKVVDIEVKPSAKLKKRANKEKYGRIASRYAKQGRHFRVLTEKDYRAHPLRSNLQRIHRASKIIKRVADAVILMAKLGEGSQWSLKAAARLVGSEDRVLALVASHQLHIDLHGVIDGQALVRLPGSKGGEDGSLFL